jgi:hypothetical protein
MGRMDLWAVKRDLAAIGVDYDALVAEGEGNQKQRLSKLPSRSESQ